MIDNKFEIGDRVYLVSDPDQHVRVITSLRVYKAGEILYTIVCGVQESHHYDFELSTEKDVTITTQ